MTTMANEKTPKNETTIDPKTLRLVSGISFCGAKASSHSETIPTA